MHDVRFVIITGLSGAGKTQAVRILEDMGYFCIDNLPPTLIPKFAELVQQSGGPRHVALVVDIRGGDFFDSVVEALGDLERSGFTYQILFLEASDDVLVRRFKETRRRHPLAPQGRVEAGLAEERHRLEWLRGKAHHILDTTNLAPQDLRRRIAELFAGEAPAGRMIVNIVSFGFKHGIPRDADIVLDVRFLPNPHYVPSLKPLTGNDRVVREYVLKWPVTRKFLAKAWSLLSFLLPHYVTEGKPQLTVAIGCTGGQHRSVVVANQLADKVRGERFPVLVEHRDVGRRRGRTENDEAVQSAGAADPGSRDERGGGLE